MYDNSEHFHSSDRFPSRDTLLWLNSLEIVRNVNFDYTTVSEDYLIVDTTTADITITLLPPSNGRKLIITNFTGANDVILTSVVNINGSSSDLNISPGVTVTVKDIGGHYLVW